MLSNEATVNRIAIQLVTNIGVVQGQEAKPYSRSPLSGRAVVASSSVIRVRVIRHNSGNSLRGCGILQP
jgi:hypothetical protein